MCNFKKLLLASVTQITMYEFQYLAVLLERYAVISNRRAQFGYESVTARIVNKMAHPTLTPSIPQSLLVDHGGLSSNL